MDRERVEGRISRLVGLERCDRDVAIANGLDVAARLGLGGRLLEEAPEVGPPVRVLSRFKGLGTGEETLVGELDSLGR